MNLNQQQLAQTLNVSDRTIRQWQNEGLPVELQAHGGNRYRLSDCIEWVVQRRVSNDLIFEKTRLVRFQADKTELETKLLRTNLVNITWGMFRQDLEKLVRAIPEKITPELLDQRHLVDCEQSLEDPLNEALAALTRIEAAALG